VEKGKPNNRVHSDTFHLLLGGFRGVPRPEGIYNPSSVLSVCSEASSQLDPPEKPPKGGYQEAP